MSVWSDVIAGFALIAGTYWLIKTVRSWRRFRRSVQKEIYSGYFEYAFRSKNLMRLSESFYFKNTFGKHRIFYQLAQAENQKAPQAYVLILLTSGLYILNIKNQGGKITAGKTGDFKQHYAEKNGNKKSQAEHLYLLENPIEDLALKLFPAPSLSPAHSIPLTDRPPDCRQTLSRDSHRKVSHPVQPEAPFPDTVPQTVSPKYPHPGTAGALPQKRFRSRWAIL